MTAADPAGSAKLARHAADARRVAPAFRYLDEMARHDLVADQPRKVCKL